MATSTTKTNKPINPRGNDQSPLAFNRAKLYSGKALDFDGVNDYVDVGTLDITGYTQMSVSFYMNVDTTTQDFRLISIRYSGADDIRIFHSASIGAGVLNFSLDDGDVDNIGVNFETNQWYHVVMTHDGATLKAYFNGVEQASTASTFDYANADGLFYVGRYTGGTVTYYDGEASNVKIFNTALTAAQVADLYNNPEKIVPTGVSNTALKLWLPMMEGAGTTAYDGSGNGNHGTISGATYVNGVGAPVAQSAVMDWNKGVNELTYSEQMSTGWAKQNITLTQNALEAPDGLTTATKFTATAADTFHINSFTYASAPAGIWKESVFAKKGEVDFAFLVIRVNGGTDRYGVKFDLTDGTFVDDITYGSPTNTGYEITDAGNGWYKCTIQALHTSGAVFNVFGPNIAGNLVDINGSHLGDGTSGMYFWGASLHLSTAGDSYVRTEATAQATPVLLPQGLTSGRDITGVNLFENVRKQGALNLDGNSWAEVHDNASLDFGTGSLTIEAWARVKYVNQGSGVNVIMTLGNEVNSSNSAGLAAATGNTVQFWYTNSSSSSALSEGDWVHIVGVYDETNATIYVNGSQVDQDARTAVSKTNALVKQIGRDTTTFRYYNDQIAQPRIYNRALTAEEVQRNYDAGKNIYTNS